MNNSEFGTSPEGDYGIYCEPKGHSNNPRWLSDKHMTYDEAINKADEMNRVNKQWHYYAKPI